MSRRELRSLTVPANEVLSVLERRGHHAAAADLRARFARIATRPPTGATRLPVDLVGRVAGFLPEKADLLALRCSSGSCKQAVVRAVKHHHACKRWRPRPTMPQNAATVAIGRVFGAGCRILDIPSHTEPVSAVATGLEPFLTSTGGLLTELYDDNNAITPDHLLILCRACPLLKRLGVKNVPNIQPADFVAVSQACPLLESVVLPTIEDLSPAETYARHFPRLRELKFTRASRGSQTPIRLDTIAVAAENCVHVTEITCPHDASVSPEFAARLLETPLRDRVTKLCFSGGSSDHQLLPETCLQLVRGFPNLDELTAPSMSALSPTRSRTEFFEQLALAAPNLRGFFSADIDDEQGRRAGSPRPYAGVPTGLRDPAPYVGWSVPSRLGP